MRQLEMLIFVAASCLALYKAPMLTLNFDESTKYTNYLFHKFK